MRQATQHGLSLFGAVALIATAGAGNATAADVPTLSSATARSEARRAVSGVELVKERRVVATCGRRTSRKQVCAVRWPGGGRGTVTVLRAGIATSPVDTFRFVGRTATRKLDETGRFIVETRSAPLGGTLRLWREDEDQVDVSFGAALDGWVSSNQFDTAPDGTRWVAYPVTATNTGKARWTHSVIDARLILPDGRALTNASPVGCPYELDMAPGETRAACVAFAVPFDVEPVQVEWRAGAETGVWGSLG